MKRLVYALIVGILVGCTITQHTDGLTKPGDKIGEMTVEQGSLYLPYPHINDFCGKMPQVYEPISYKGECDVPLISGLAIDFGWMAKETKLENNWDALVWVLYIDDYQIDLKAFDLEEFDFIAHGENNKMREWLIDLKNLAPGQHTLRYSWTSEIAIDDGFRIYQPGMYEHVVNFTVLEKVVYPPLSSTVNIGQHPYTSEQAQLDFLLYLPSDYGNDSQQEWPLIVYLHGANLRGTTLELLMEEPLPRKLEEETDFPFIVVSPLGDGDFEFWGKDQMIAALFTLLDEIQNEYSVNTKRIFLTGNDMGGNGVWMIGLRYPEYFAALAPVSGYFSYPFKIPENICDLKNVPVWAFHGGRDHYVPVDVEQELVDALSACGGKAQYTVSQDMKTDVLYKVYTDPALYEWFLSQTTK